MHAYLSNAMRLPQNTLLAPGASASDQADYNILPLVILRSLDARTDSQKQIKKNHHEP